MEFRRITFKKMEIGEYFFEKNHGKLTHWRNLSPKIFYAIEVFLGFANSTSSMRVTGVITMNSISGAMTISLCI
jgi:hypothetical protein